MPEAEILPAQKVHAHAFTSWQVVRKVPTADGGHTSFMLIGCACRAVDVFGSGNLALAAPEAVEALRELVRKGGNTPLF